MNGTQFPKHIENYRIDALRLTSDAKDQLAKFQRDVSSSPISSLSYAYTARVKSEHGVLEKILRKRNGGGNIDPKPNYCLSDITDIVGIRFVTLYRNQIGVILEYILSELTGSPISTSIVDPRDIKGIFASDSLKEAIIYTNNPNDRFIPRWENLFRGVCGDKLKVVSDKVDYSSIHIVAGLESKESNDIIPIEIQIRSVFDDVWGNLNHDLIYKAQSGKKTEHLFGDSQFIHKILSNLKQFTDACANYADLIYEETTGNPDAVKSADVIDVDDKNVVILKFKELKINPKLIDIYKEASSSKEHADNKKNDKQASVDSIDAMYSDAAKLFKRAYENAANENVSKELKIFRFYAQLNEALCYLLTSRHVSKAIEIYSELLLSNEAVHPMLFFRFGQALEKSGDSVNGIEFVRKGWDTAKESVVNGAFDDSGTFLLQDLQHLSVSAPRKLGYYIWHQAENAFNENNIDAETFGASLEEAYNTSRDGVEFLKLHNIEINISPKDLSSLHNNLLYYVTELLRVTGYGNSNREQWLQKVEEHLNYVLEEAKSGDISIQKMDTLWRAYELLGNIDRSRFYAQKVLSLSLESKADAGLTAELLRDMAKKAFKMLEATKI